jgi:hypothetical protein
MKNPTRPVLAALALACALAPLPGLAAQAPSPSPSPDAMHGSAMHGDAMHGDAMHGDAMHGDAMHGAMTHASYMKDALAAAKADLAMQKQAAAMKGIDAKTAALAKKRASDDAEYIRLITVAMQAEHPDGG